MKRFSIFLSLLILVLSGCAPKSVLSPANPVNIVLWHYYNGAHLAAMDSMVEQFNETVGREKGIFVTALSQGGVNDLGDKVIAAARDETGAEPMPHIFGAYPDVTLSVDLLGAVADLDAYLTDEDKGRFVDSYLDEGVLPTGAAHKILPFAKSYEIIMLDENAFSDLTQADSSITADTLSTWEGVVRASKAYCEYTDGLTPDVPNDGTAFFGIDSLANFILVTMRQQGTELVSYGDGRGEINLNREHLRRIWDIYYPSMVQGWFGHSGRYRSDDFKIGLIIGFSASTTGGMYFPEAAVSDAGAERATELAALPYPVMKGGVKAVVQQGAGMVVAKSDEQHEAASVEFLKWFTQPERNTDFAMMTSYLPVTKQAFSDQLPAALEVLSAGARNQQYVGRVFSAAIEQMSTHEAFWSTPFEGSYDFRKLLESSITEMTLAAREGYIAALAAGESQQAAYEAFVNDEAFDAWYRGLEAFSLGR